MRNTCTILVISIVSLMQTACSGEVGCDTPRQEPLSASSSLHLLGNTEATWETNPPTSGPHYPVPPRGGNYDYTLSNLEQVAFLESGGVIIQFLPNNKNVDLQQLRSFANQSVIVSPNQTLESSLVATAWTWKLTCAEYLPEKLNKFVSEYQGKVSNNHQE